LSNNQYPKQSIEQREMRSEIWEWYRGYYKVYLEDSVIKRQITGWGECKEHCYYFHLDGKRGWDVIFPSKLYNRVAKLVSLPLKQKNLKRVQLGRMLGGRAVAENRLEIKKGYQFSNG